LFVDQGDLFVTVEYPCQGRIDLEPVKVILAEMDILGRDRKRGQEVNNYSCSGYVQFHVSVSG
jgi:hypothetical protein